jgi:hypothetical protein
MERTVISQVVDNLNEAVMACSDNKGDDFFIFRGINKCDDDSLREDRTPLLQSGAAIRLKKESKTSQLDFLQYHDNLVKYARENYKNDLYEYKSLSDLDILAQIEHTRGATCLIDFSTNFLIALYFACAATDIEKQGDGYVFFLNVNSVANEDILFNVTENNKNDPISTLLQRKARAKSSMKTVNNRFWYWKPDYTNNRIRRQDSIFVFGLDTQLDPKKGLKYGCIKIPVGDKQNILNELNRYFNISVLNIYDDLPGFSGEANNKYIAISKEILPSERCLSKIKQLIKSEEYDRAEGFCIKILNCIFKQDEKCQLCEQIDKNIREFEVLNQYSIVFYRKSKQAEDVEKSKDLLIKEVSCLCKTQNIINELINNGQDAKLQDYKDEVLSVYRRLVYCYYECFFYKEGLDVVNNYFSKIASKSLFKDDDKRDWIYMGLELSLLSKKFDQYDKFEEKYKKSLSNIDDLLYKDIHFLFNKIHEVLKLNKDEDSSKLNDRLEKKGEEYSKYYGDKNLCINRCTNVMYWGFGDIKYLLENSVRTKDNNSNYLYLSNIVNALEELQNKIKDMATSILPA